MYINLFFLTSGCTTGSDFTSNYTSATPTTPIKSVKPEATEMDKGTAVTNSPLASPNISATAMNSIRPAVSAKVNFFQKASPIVAYAPTQKPSVKSNVTTGYSCGSKTKCGEMGSCAEAKFYLTSCGLSRLDGDSDGVPCESLCK